MGVGGVGALVERGSRRVLLEATCRPANRRVVESACEEVADRGRDLRGVGLEREVARVEEMDSRTGNIASERLGTARQKEGIILSPHRQELGLVRPEVMLECRGQGGVAFVGAERCRRNSGGTGSGQIEVFE